MKNTLKVFGVIALAVVIGFSIAACSNGSTSGDIVPKELQGTWVGSAGTITINGSSAIVDDGSGPRTLFIKSVQKGSVKYINGENWTVYTVKSSEGDIVCGLSQDGRTMLDDDGNYFQKQ